MLSRVTRFCRLLWVCCIASWALWAGGLFAQTPPKVVGTAFVVNADGYLLTCAHGVKNAEKTEITIGGKTYPASVLEMDEPHDLALLHIEAKGLPTLPLGNSDAVEVGEEVWAFGFPLGHRLGESVKIARGTISGIESQAGTKLFQLDELINPGNSGGPLLNSEGEVVGIVRAKTLSSQKETSVGFAMPVAYAAKLLADHHVAASSETAKTKWEGPALFKRVSPGIGLLTSVMRTGEKVTFLITPDGRYQAPQFNFSITPPPGWKREVSGHHGMLAFTNSVPATATIVDIVAVGGLGNRELVAFAGPIAPGGGAFGLVSIIHRHNPEVLSLYEGHMRDVLAAAVPGFKLVSDIRSTINGQEAYRIAFTFRLNVNKETYTWQNLKGIFGPGDEKFEITCAALESQFPLFAQTFSALLDSVRIGSPANKVK